MSKYQIHVKFSEVHYRNVQKANQMATVVPPSPVHAFPLRLMFKASKLFWRCHTRIECTMYVTEQGDCVEVIIVNLEDGTVRTILKTFHSFIYHPIMVFFLASIR